MSIIINIINEKPINSIKLISSDATGISLRNVEGLTNNNFELRRRRTLLFYHIQRFLWYK